jgi:hypothetical protein
MLIGHQPDIMSNAVASAEEAGIAYVYMILPHLLVIIAATLLLFAAVKCFPKPI